ncbi:hypothetical protein [Candidatus Uabimicrobium amorphum]|uniref:DUF11 domain-containing protein n=1 Tax=Uabimicrobium amorphum TaxID=2596890 RepID=A0A5S9IM50_UABAM|nr:hypothetical protein [Candidatus Uabimicrobium amorphum]BBM83966.1 hypothetical protein UABAM_02321 [Candidatus Uabimicrobium amorphum]
MRKFLYILVFSLTILQAQEKSVSYAKVFPKDSLAVFSLTDVEATKKQFKQTHLYSFLQEPEIKRLVEQIEKKYSWDNFSRRLKVATGLTLQESLSVFAGEISIALVDIPSGSEPIQIAVIINYKNHGEKAHKLLNALVERVPVNKGSYTIGKQQISYIKGLETALHYTTKEECFLFATTPKLMSSMLANIDKPGNRLQETPQYQKTAHIFQGGSVNYYFDIAKFLHVVEGYMQTREKVALQSMGIFDWKAIAASFAIDKPHFVSQMRLVVDGNKGLNRFFAIEGIPQSVGKNIPKNSGGWVTANIDFAQLWNEYLTCYRNYEKELQQQGNTSENSYSVFYDNVRKFEKAFLETTVSEVLSAVGPHLAFFHLPDPAGGLIPRWVATANTNNPQLLKKTLNIVFDLLHYEFKEKPYKGRTLYYLAEKTGYQRNPLVQISRSERETLRMFLGTFSFYIENNQIFITRIVQDLMDLIDTYDAGMDSLNLHNISPVKSAQNPYGVLLFIDWNILLPPVYNTLLPFIPSWEDEMSYFFGQGTIKSVDFPRMSTIIKYLSPVIGGLESGNATFALRTNFNFDFYMAQGLLWLQMSDVWGPVVSKYLDELDDYLLVNEEVVKLVKQQRFYAAYRMWESFAKRARFESFRLIARKENQGLREKYTKITKELTANLQKSFRGELAAWRVVGDWKWGKGELSATNESQDTFSLIIGENPLEDYVIHLEVKDIKDRLDVFFHWNESFDGSASYKKVSFYERKEQSGKWIPLKFKVHKDRISYWYGLKHHVIYANATSGLFGFHLPSDAKVRIRNLRLQVEKQVTPKYEQPVVYIQANDTVDPVFQNENTQYLFVVKNQGNKQITNAHVKITLPSSMRLISASGAKYSVRKNQEILFGPTVIGPNKALKCKLNVKVVSAGSFTVPATITFDNLQGKIVVTERTHVLSD